MTYTGADGTPHRPYMVHRALLGSIERFFGILVEHHAGAFPLWLAPEQVRVMPLTDKQLPYAQSIVAALRQRDFRVTVDASPDKIGAKIRQAQVDKIPYMAVVGGREEQAGKVALRHRTAGDLGPMDLDAVIARLQDEVARKGVASAQE
jgi:threonyl-tRNA synthetase